MTEHVLNIARAVAREGGRALIVGGWVRDRLLGLESKDRKSTRLNSSHT